MNQVILVNNNQQEEGIFIQIIPHHVYITINSPGSGRNPVPGDFITLRQRTYNQNMIIVAQGRKSYIFGRNRLIQGLQVGLSFVCQGMKGRFRFSSEFGYGSQGTHKIGSNQDIFMDFEIYSISQKAQNFCSDQETFSQLIYISKKADQQAALGNWYDCKRFYQKAISIIAIQKLHMKKYDKMRQTIMLIHIKAMQVCVIVRDYYQAIILAQKYSTYQGKFKDARCMLVRAKAYSQIGQFQLAQADLNELLMINPELKSAKNLLTKVLQTKKRMIKIGYNQYQDLLPIDTKFTKQKQSQLYNYKRFIQRISTQAYAERQKQQMENLVQQNSDTQKNDEIKVNGQTSKMKMQNQADEQKFNRQSKNEDEDEEHYAWRQEQQNSLNQESQIQRQQNKNAKYNRYQQFEQGCQKQQKKVYQEKQELSQNQQDSQEDIECI